MPHPDLLALSGTPGRPVTDAWVMKLAALHVREMILTDRDMDKTLVTASVHASSAISAELDARSL